MIKRITLFILLACVNLLNAQETNVLIIDSVPFSGIELSEFWKFHEGDDSVWAGSDFDDSSWDTIYTGELDSTHFKGMGWFRLHLKFDSSLASLPIAISIMQAGASEIYCNGTKLISFGKVSADGTMEERYYPNLLPVALNIIPNQEYVIAIRYSNHKVGHNRNIDLGSGFFAFIFPANEMILFIHDDNIGISNISSIFLFGFIIALGIAHFFIFLFYSANKSNLFYFFFATLLSLYALSPFFQTSVSNPILYDGFDNVSSVLFPLFLFTLIILVHSIFYDRFLKIVWFIFFLNIITTLFLFFQWEFTNILFIFFIAISIIEVLRVIIIALIKKKQGALIIGAGIGIFILIMAAMILFLLYTDSGDISESLLFLLDFAILSIPVSMSLYLAKQFATTNKILKKKLTEVESLSAKNLEQEKEKQKILETQKETLEIQVQERTLEISEQKKVIEEKNKDITDSIDYAKTIQDAILPTKELKQRLFADSFILFKPKDIVSGDFYWFAEKDGKKLIAACDCTGHGVPGALMSMIGSNILNQIVNEKGITAPNEILNHLHKEIRKTLKQEDQNETKDGMDISLITFNTETEIEFAGAQRPFWIIKKIDTGELTIDNGTNQQLTEIKGNKFAIGGLQSETERTFTNHKLSLSKGDCIYIFTDGYADQFSDTDKKLMTSRFKELLISIQQKSMPEQEKFLGGFIENWRGTRDQIDDILVIGIRI